MDDGRGGGFHLFGKNRDGRRENGMKTIPNFVR